jgi:hypothetical protein
MSIASAAQEAVTNTVLLGVKVVDNTAQMGIEVTNIAKDTVGNSGKVVKNVGNIAVATTGTLSSGFKYINDSADASQQIHEQQLRDKVQQKIEQSKEDLQIKLKKIELNTKQQMNIIQNKEDTTKIEQLKKKEQHLKEYLKEQEQIEIEKALNELLDDINKKYEKNKESGFKSTKLQQNGFNSTVQNKNTHYLFTWNKKYWYYYYIPTVITDVNNIEYTVIFDEDTKKYYIENFKCSSTNTNDLNDKVYIYGFQTHTDSINAIVECTTNPLKVTEIKTIYFYTQNKFTGGKKTRKYKKLNKIKTKKLNKERKSRKNRKSRKSMNRKYRK